ncbi:helix-turn-helix domain-containing protein [Methanobrevibacter arboriphilus]|uniref:helix-turn-helix domain-containing protein n=1 Tax=Methanobrevibacter arboriphilus TaxID=39441 RepID=UPI002F420AC6
MSITSLKTSFKAIYGKPVYAWRKEYRLQIAKELLNKEDYKISEIANKVGYKNPSKFSAAFKEYYKLTPSQYRLQKINIFTYFVYLDCFVFLVRLYLYISCVNIL